MAISGIDSPISSAAITGTVRKADPSGLGGADITVPIDRTVSTQWTYGSSGADTINQVIRKLFTATKNTTTSLDLSGALVNLVGDTAATLTKVKKMRITYLSSTVPSTAASYDATNGNASTGTVVIQPGASNPITTSPLGAAETHTMKPGDIWDYESHDTNGFTVTGGSADTFDFVHGDNVLDGKFLIEIFGNS